MPKGKLLRETGILRRAMFGYALEMDGGGHWMLETRGGVRKLIGKRITVEGKRMGFDVLFVDRIWLDGKQMRRGLLTRIELWIVITTTTVPFVLQWF